MNIKISHLRKQPVLLIVIDTEEERSWGSYSRDDTSVKAVREVWRAQRIFDDFGIRPTYVVDFPVASQIEAYAPLRDILSTGRCLIGAHLHSWVNPPYSEFLSPRNTFPGNLSPDVEKAKLECLVGEIEKTFNERPTIYKAGRYGIGPNTPSILVELGFEVDLSPSPPFDFREGGGPDFRRTGAAPRWLKPTLLQIPTTGAYTGLLAKYGPELYSRIAAAEWCKAGGICSRLKLLERIRLSPEGFSFRDQRNLTEWLLKKNVNVLTWSFHSPSLQVGGSPYVKDGAAQQELLEANRRYFEYFKGTLGGCFMTPLELRQKMLDEAPV